MKMHKIFGLFLLLILTSGCLRYGSGEAIGYINAVDDGLVWDKVWIKTSLETSTEDCYLVAEDSGVKILLKDLIGEKVKIKYDRHLSTIGSCPEGTDTSDEIIGFEILEE